MILYDNVDDAAAKLTGTIIMHKDKAVYVHQVFLHPLGKFWLRLKEHDVKHMYDVPLDSPDLNYTRFRLGYVTHGPYVAWFYRKPMKQFRQGLRSDQLSKTSANAYAAQAIGWDYDTPITNMLENVYPSLDDCMKQFVDKGTTALAFHKDFAATWDPIHRDVIVEYKGRNIGHTPDLSNRRSFKLMKHFKHLTEALTEAVA